MSGSLGTTTSSDFLIGIISSSQRTTNWNSTFADNQTTAPENVEDPSSTPRGVVIFFIILFVCIIPPIVIGNGLVIVSFLKFDKLSSTAHMFIANLAVADVLVGIFSVPLTIVFRLVPALDGVDDKTDGMNRDPGLCLMWTYFTLVPSGASVLSLLCVAICLYVTMHHPFKFAIILSKKRARRTVTFIWVYMTTISTGIALGVMWDEEKQECNYLLTNYAYLRTILTVIHLLIPFILIFIIYAYLFKKMRQLSERNICRKGTCTFARAKKSTVKMAKFTSIAVALFFLSWVIMGLIYAFSPHGESADILLNFGAWLAFGNSLVNPIIYGTKNREFKNAFKQLLCCYGNELTVLKRNLTRINKRTKRGKAGSLYVPTKGEGRYVVPRTSLATSSCSLDVSINSLPTGEVVRVKAYVPGKFEEVNANTMDTSSYVVTDDSGGSSRPTLLETKL